MKLACIKCEVNLDKNVWLPDVFVACHANGQLALKIVYQRVAKIERTLSGLIPLGDFDADAVEEIRDAQSPRIRPSIDVDPIGMRKAFLIATRRQQFENVIHS